MIRRRIHNFDSQRWGHSQYLSLVSQDSNGAAQYRGMVISTPVVHEGDIIEWATEYGRARILVESTEYVRDPDDMTKVVSAWMFERLNHDGAVIWSKLDVLAAATEEA